MRHFFITGATGVVGSAFLKRIAGRQERATLLLRAKTPVDLTERLARLLYRCAIPAPAARRIDAVGGDLYRRNLGMDPPAYEGVSRSCTHIVHCAGDVKMNLPLAQASRQTLSMARGVLDLLTSARRVEKLVFVSTVGVAGRTTGELPEDWINPPGAFRNTYEAAKFEAEKLMRSAHDAGHPLVVVRPSMVVGDSRSGEISHFQVFYYLCEFLSGARSHGVLPRTRGMRLDLIPCDHVAALLDLSSTTESRQPVLHACSGKSGAIEIGALTHSVRQCFQNNGRRLPPIRTLPLPLFRIAAVMMRPLLLPKQRRALMVLPHFLAYLKEDQWFADRFTRQLMSGSKIHTPRVHDYLGNVLGYYLSCRCGS